MDATSPRPGLFDEWESALRARADEELPALAVARSGTEALIAALAGAEVAPPGDDPPPSYFMRSSILLLAAIGLRTARACLLVISVGYEPEAQALKRRLSEIHMRAEAVVSDQSGEHARAWLDGRGPSAPRRLANQFGNLDVWDTYSASGHADARGIDWWLSIPMPGDAGPQQGVVVQPHRRGPLGNAMLTEIAMECRDLAHVLARTRGGDLAGLAELDVQIEASIAAYYAPDSAEGSQ